MNLLKQHETDPMDGFIESSLKNWVSKTAAPRNARNLLLQAARQKPIKMRRSLFSSNAEDDFRLHAEFPQLSYDVSTRMVGHFMRSSFLQSNTSVLQFIG